ncbi:MAG TPA: serine hydrolase [Chloroflexota bacterium]|nr:serine hydrolase [Chloroflexota bacterium]
MTTASPATAPSWASALDDFARALAEKHAIPGLAVAVASGGRTVHELCLGYRDTEQQLPVTPDTIFGIGSVSKSFTALAILQLQDAGALSVHDAVSKHLPTFRLPGEHGARYTPEITLHHLLTHTSGIPPEPVLFRARVAAVRADPDLLWMEVPDHVRDAVARLEPITTYAALLDAIAAHGFAPLGPPGRCFSYSNEGYALLAATVERVSGLSFPRYVQERIAAPLELTRTGCRTPDFPLTPPVAQIYSRGTRDGTKGVFAAPHWWGLGDIFGNGNLISTTRDLLRYLELFLGEGEVDGRRFVSREAIHAMTSPHVAMHTSGFYGYGLMVYPGYHGVTLIGHAGGNKGISADAVFVPERGIAAAGLANLAGVPIARVTRGVINALLDLPLETKPETFPGYELASERLAEYAGLYRSEDGHALTVSVDGDALLVQGPVGPAQRARPYGEDAFVVESADAPARFLRDEAGAVWALADVRVVRKVS